RSRWSRAHGREWRRSCEQQQNDSCKLALDAPWRGAGSPPADAGSRAVSRTFKEMRAVGGRKRNAVLSRQQARRWGQQARKLSDGYERRGRRKEDLPSSDRTEKEDVT